MRASRPPPPAALQIPAELPAYGSLGPLFYAFGLITQDELKDGFGSCGQGAPSIGLPVLLRVGRFHGSGGACRAAAAWCGSRGRCHERCHERWMRSLDVAAASPAAACRRG